MLTGRGRTLAWAAQCGCCAGHTPVPSAVELHHIWPKGQGGPDTRDNLVPLCPTAHTIVHSILDPWIRSGAITTGRGRRNRFCYEVAVDGFRRWEAAQGTPG